MDDLGFAWSPDLNAEGSTGVSPFPLNWDPETRKRCSVNDAYLQPHRDSIMVGPNMAVRRLLFSGAGDEARVVGVETIAAGTGEVNRYIYACDLATKRHRPPFTLGKPGY